MQYNKANRIILDHGVELPNGQVFLTKPLGVFKKVLGVRRGTSARRRMDQIMKDVTGYPNTDQATRLKNLFNNSYSVDREDLIANLLLPVGTVVNFAQDTQCKMRASRAICWSVVSMKGKDDSIAYSGRDASFLYMPYKHVGFGSDKDKLSRLVLNASNHHDLFSIFNKSYINPNSFDTSTKTCSTGVHFFVDLKDAKNYYL